VDGKTLDDLFKDQLKDLYSAENQLVKALPWMAKNAAASEASCPALKCWATIDRGTGQTAMGAGANREHEIVG